VIGDGEVGRRGARWLKVTFTLDSDFLALKRLKNILENIWRYFPE